MGKWINPSQSEAQDEYDSAKRRYSNAASDYIQAKNKYDSCSQEYSKQKQNYDSASSEKINFEKRVEQIEKIIKLLSDGGNVNDAVSDANSAAEKAESALSGSVKCSGINSPNLSRAFRCRTVEEDPDSANALAEFKKEKSRLEQSIQQVEAQIRAMEESVEALEKQMSSLASAQSSAQRVMRSSSYDMNHYKKYI